METKTLFLFLITVLCLCGKGKSSDAKKESSSRAVQATCLTTAKDLTGSSVPVTCPPDCLASEKRVWGTDVYTDDSSICKAAIHAGLLDNNGGLVRVKKIPGQATYRGSPRNGLNTGSYGAWSGSFTFFDLTILTTPTTTKEASKKATVQVTCITTARDLPGSSAEVNCPPDCLASENRVWGTDVYTDDSSVCKAAIHAGLLDNNGGLVRVKKIPGQATYRGSPRNGLNTGSYGAWTRSFTFFDLKVPTTPTTTKAASNKTTAEAFPFSTRVPTTPMHPTAPAMTKVDATCGTTARFVTSSPAEFSCPPGCLASRGYIWGTDIYTDDSSVCRAAIHAGILDNNGGPVSVMKTPGQASYSGSLRNGIISSSNGVRSGSFVFLNGPVQNTSSPTEAAPQNGAVQATCSTSARDFTGSSTKVNCPRDCLASRKSVWGTDIYSDDSSVCKAAIHAGYVDNNGGLVSVERISGQVSYSGSTRNGITTSSYGPWPGSFKFSHASVPITTIPTTETTAKLAAPVTCLTTARDLTRSPAEILCPQDCHLFGKSVWGTNVYTDDSSVCQAAIHAGILDNSGGQVTVETISGQASYIGSTRNGVTTSSYGAWPGSFKFPYASIPITTNPTETATVKKTVQATCLTSARDFMGSSAEVICPHDCLASSKSVWGTDVYTDDSSICKAAVHAGLLDNNGGLVSVEKIPGQASYSGSTKNGITTSSYGPWSGSFILAESSIPMTTTATKATTPKLAVAATCSTTARDLTASPAELLCPQGCLISGKNIWGTNVYTDDSSVCQAAIHAGILDNNGGQVTVEKISGQDSYIGSTRNGVTTSSYGAWPGSFKFPYASIPITTNPTKAATLKTAVQGTCMTSASDFVESSAEVNCPNDCLASSNSVWGTDVYTDDSSICKAAIHAGLLDNNGGLVSVEKIPGQASYRGSTRKGITTSSYGSWSGSFTFSNTSIPMATTPKMITTPKPAVPATCSNTARELTGTSAEVDCPRDCLTSGKRVWGTDVYTDDSYVCQAAIHAGLLDNNGGVVVLEKTPGQASYSGSTRNGITTSSYGAWPGSFIFSNTSIQMTTATKTTASQNPTVQATCSTTARDLIGSSTEINCPQDCITTVKMVWGTDIYTDDSSVCQAAIHAGLLGNSGGLVTVEKMSGQASYIGSTKNGVTTSSYGAWSGSFKFTYSSKPVITTPTTTHLQPTTTKATTQTVAVQATCSITARDLAGSSAKVYCPHDCLASGKRVWGTDVYTDDSHICQAAIHAGLLDANGGLVSIEKMPGQASYNGSTRNGITTSSYGGWPGSFIFWKASKPMTTTPKTLATLKPSVQATCSTTGQHLMESFAEVNCPGGCFTADIRVWGTDVYTDDSCVCQAAIHAGLLDNNGGLVSVEKIFGQDSYRGSTRNGITSSSYGTWAASFRFSNTSIPMTTPPTTAATEKTAAKCSTSARNMTGSSAEVNCPPGCLASEWGVWGTDIYTDDSSVCKAAIHAGLLDDNGGVVSVRKMPGQTRYSGSTRNGIKTYSDGTWSGSFTFLNGSLLTNTIPTTASIQNTAVRVACSTTARDIAASSAVILCPYECFTIKKSVWGTEIYTEASEICAAAIHAGKIDNNGGVVTIQKAPGQDSYQGSSKNGITTESFGISPGSFTFY